MTPCDTAQPLVLGVLLVPLLRRMRRDFDADGGLRTATAALMWCAYAGGAAAFAGAIRDAGGLTRPTAAFAAAPAVVGAVLLVAGMGAFDGAGQVTGTRTGPLVTGGPYRYSRNPQYAGTVLLASVAVAAARSPTAAALTGLLAGAYRWWVPVEERALERRFADDYLDYRSRTPRWLRLPAA